MQSAAAHIPGESLGPVIDRWLERCEGAVQHLGLAGLKPVELAPGAPKIRRLAPIDLSARFGRLVDEHRPQACFGQAPGRPDARGTGADDDYACAGHGTCRVTIFSPSATGVPQARK